MSRPIVNVADARTHSDSHGERFAYTMSELAAAAGGRAIGANVTRVPPGKAAFPFHHHRGNEEHFFILAGTGVLRLGAQAHPVRPQDYIVNLPGGPEDAHQLVNTGEEDLVYLAISTRSLPDVVGYPDSGKTGVRTGPPGEPGSRFLVADGARDTVSYWDGESGERILPLVGPRR